MKTFTKIIHIGFKGLLSLAIILALIIGTVIGTLGYAAMKSDIRTLYQKNASLSRKINELQQEKAAEEEPQIYHIRKIPVPGDSPQLYSFYTH